MIKDLLKTIKNKLNKFDHFKTRNENEQFKKSDLYTFAITLDLFSSLNLKNIFIKILKENKISHNHHVEGSIDVVMNETGLVLEESAGLLLEERAGLVLEERAGLVLEERAGLVLEESAGLVLEERAGLNAEGRAGLAIDETDLIHENILYLKSVVRFCLLSISDFHPFFINDLNNIVSMLRKSCLSNSTHHLIMRYYSVLAIALLSGMSDQEKELLLQRVFPTEQDLVLAKAEYVLVYVSFLKL